MDDGLRFSIQALMRSAPLLNTFQTWFDHSDKDITIMVSPLNPPLQSTDFCLLATCDLDFSRNAIFLLDCCVHISYEWKNVVTPGLASLPRIPGGTRCGIKGCSCEDMGRLPAWCHVLKAKHKLPSRASHLCVPPPTTPEHSRNVNLFLPKAEELVFLVVFQVQDLGESLLIVKQIEWETSWSVIMSWSWISGSSSTIAGLPGTIWRKQYPIDIMTQHKVTQEVCLQAISPWGRSGFTSNAHKLPSHSRQFGTLVRVTCKDVIVQKLHTMCHIWMWWLACFLTYNNLQAHATSHNACYATPSQPLLFQAWTISHTWVTLKAPQPFWRPLLLTRTATWSVSWGSPHC